VGLEPTIPAFERAKAVRALDRAATVIGTFKHYIDKFHASQNGDNVIQGPNKRNIAVKCFPFLYILEVPRSNLDLLMAIVT
jgi:hypothetical protein